MAKRRVQERVLPIYEAGSWHPPHAIAGFDEVMTEDTSWPEHSHPGHELTWNERGASMVAVGSRQWTLTPLLGLWMPAGVVHSAWTPAGTWYRAAHFDVDDVPALADEPVVVEITPLLRLLLERLRDDTLPKPSRMLTEALVRDVLVPSPHGILIRFPTAPLLQPIVERVRKDPSDCGSLAEWSRRLRVNPRTITRAFQTETGLGFERWIATVRMRHAVHLLSRGVAVEDIAAETGYRSVSAFGAAFRRITGATPGSFRP